MATGISVGYSEAHFRSRYTSRAAHAMTPESGKFTAVCGVTIYGRPPVNYDEPLARVTCKRCQKIIAGTARGKG
jgi:glutamine amidotransferase-like uncharacterized protein